MIGTLLDALRNMGNHKRLLLLQLVMNAALVLAFGAWLWIPDSNVPLLVFSFTSMLVMVLIFLLLHGHTVVTFRDATSTRPWKQAAGNVLGAVLWVAVFALLVSVILQWRDSADQIGGYIYSRLPIRVRGWTSNEGVIEKFTLLLNSCMYYFLPALLLPFGVEILTFGVRHAAWKSCAKIWLRPAWWIGLLPVSLCLFYAPDQLLAWQFFKSVHGQFFSVGIRLLLAYLAILLPWLFTLALAGSQLQRLAPQDSPAIGSSGDSAAKPA